MLFFEAAADEFAELEDRGVGDGVEDLEAFLAAREEAAVGEGLQVAGDVGLGAAGQVDEGVDGFLAVEERVEEAQAHGLGQQREAAGDEGEGILGERSGFLGHVTQ